MRQVGVYVRCGTCQKVVVSLSISRSRNDSRELYDANRCSKMVVCSFFFGIRSRNRLRVRNPFRTSFRSSRFCRKGRLPQAENGSGFRCGAGSHRRKPESDSARPIRRTLPGRRRARSISPRTASPRTASLRLRSRAVPCGVCRASDCAAVRSAVPDRPCGPSGRQPAPRPNPP